jgi:hypothetical protein
VGVPSSITWFNPGKKVYWHGRWWDEAMVTALKEVERETGKVQYFYQGSFNKGVGASAGTHNAGGVGDGQSLGVSHRKAQSKCGVVSWPRTRAQGFSIHDHFLLVGASTAHSTLKAQMYAWLKNQNGLARKGRDDSGVRSTFRSYPAWRASLKAVVPDAYLDGINKSRQFGADVRYYNSVKLVQKALNELYKDFPLLVDGIYGPATTKLYDKWRAEMFGEGPQSTGEVGAVGLKLLFSRANMRVNVRAVTGGPVL